MTQDYCKKCSFRCGCTCEIYAKRSIFDIKVCPLTTMYYNNLNEELEFLLTHDPVLFSKWVSKKMPIKVGDSVIALRSGFGVNGEGKKLTVKDYDLRCNYWTLIDHKGDEYAIFADTWYEDVIKEILPEEELKEALEELALVEELVDEADVNKYSDSVYNSFRKEVCYYCHAPCKCRKIDIYKCPKFENYFEI